MSERIKELTASEMEVLSRILGETMTGSQMNDIFCECNINDTSNESTKWKRIYYTFLNKQKKDNCSNSFFYFLKKCLNPVRFVSGDSGNYNQILTDINKPLMLLGFQITPEGKLKRIVPATTISEVERRTASLITELQKRHIHPDVLNCCKTEYLQENYFHAVFEAAKSLSDKVRTMTSIQADGQNESVPKFV